MTQSLPSFPSPSQCAPHSPHSSPTGLPSVPSPPATSSSWPNCLLLISPFPVQPGPAPPRPSRLKQRPHAHHPSSHVLLVYLYLCLSVSPRDCRFLERRDQLHLPFFFRSEITLCPLRARHGPSCQDGEVNQPAGQRSPSRSAHCRPAGIPGTESLDKHSLNE